jgi:NO-binding membrane sensor protein with MHYT domain
MNVDGPALVGSYDYRLIAVSILVAIFAAYASMGLAGRITVARGATRFAWLGGGSFAMGTGIWSMHCVAMEALRLPVPVEYDWPTVLLSMVAAVAASAVALFVVSRKTMGITASLVGSTLTGFGIAAMHYIGMEAMRLPAMCSYSFRLVALSVVLAVLLSFVVLWSTFAVKGQTATWSWRRSGWALLMGLAILVMHYVGMAAVSFIPTPLPASELAHAVGISQLGVAGIGLATLIVLGLVFRMPVLDRRFSLQAMKLEMSDERYRLMAETTNDRARAKAAEGGSQAMSELLVGTSQEIHIH